MMRANPSGFQSARKPKKLLGKMQATSRFHAPKDFDLLGTGLFVRKHGRILTGENRENRERIATKRSSPFRPFSPV
jgi:hypothetical protein